MSMFVGPHTLLDPFTEAAMDRMRKSMREDSGPLIPLDPVTGDLVDSPEPNMTMRITSGTLTPLATLSHAANNRNTMAMRTGRRDILTPLINGVAPRWNILNSINKLKKILFTLSALTTEEVAAKTQEIESLVVFALLSAPPGPPNGDEACNLAYDCAKDDVIPLTTKITTLISKLEARKPEPQVDAPKTPTPLLRLVQPTKTSQLKVYHLKPSAAAAGTPIAPRSLKQPIKNVKLGPLQPKAAAVVIAPIKVHQLKPSVAAAGTPTAPLSLKQPTKNFKLKPLQPKAATAIIAPTVPVPVARIAPPVSGAIANGSMKFDDCIAELQHMLSILPTLKESPAALETHKAIEQSVRLAVFPASQYRPSELILLLRYAQDNEIPLEAKISILISTLRKLNPRTEVPDAAMAPGAPVSLAPITEVDGDVIADESWKLDACINALQRMLATLPTLEADNLAEKHKTIEWLIQFALPYLTPDCEAIELIHDCATDHLIPLKTKISILISKLTDLQPPTPDAVAATPLAPIVVASPTEADSKMDADRQLIEFRCPGWSKVTTVYSTHQPVEFLGKYFWLKLEKTGDEIGAYFCCDKSVIYTGEKLILEYQLMLKHIETQASVCESECFKTTFEKGFPAWGLSKFTTLELAIAEGAYNPAFSEAVMKENYDPAKDVLTFTCEFRKPPKA